VQAPPPRADPGPVRGAERKARVRAVAKADELDRTAEEASSSIDRFASAPVRPVGRGQRGRRTRKRRLMQVPGTIAAQGALQAMARPWNVPTSTSRMTKLKLCGREGVDKYGVGEWQTTKENSRGRLDARSEKQARDKNRYMIRPYQIRR
jgi:hypothetical protein